jgi:hypothetical protein
MASQVLLGFTNSTTPISMNRWFCKTAPTSNHPLCLSSSGLLDAIVDENTRRRRKGFNSFEHSPALHIDLKVPHVSQIGDAGASIYLSMYYHSREVKIEDLTLLVA